MAKLTFSILIPFFGRLYANGEWLNYQKNVYGKWQVVTIKHSKLSPPEFNSSTQIKQPYNCWSFKVLILDYEVIKFPNERETIFHSSLVRSDEAFVSSIDIDLYLRNIWNIAEFITYWLVCSLPF